MSTNAGLAALATIMSGAFALSTWERYLQNRRTHHLAWTQSLAMFTVAAAAFWWACSTGWTDISFRVFYLFGAILNVPYLAMGTVALLGDADAAPRRLRALHLGAAFCAGVVLAAPIDGPVPREGIPSGRELFGMGPRIMAAVGSGLGATILIVGAGLSVVRLVRASRSPAEWGGPVPPGRLAVTNLAIALGSLVLGAGGGLSDSDEQRGFAIALAVGISVLFAGFLASNTGPTDRSVRRGGIGRAVDQPSRSGAIIPLSDELIALARGEMA